MFRARAAVLLYILAFRGTAIASQAKSTSGPPPTPQTAQTDPIALGRTYLKLGDLEKARSNCEASLPKRPNDARNCLAELVQAQYEAKLRDFESSVDLGKREEAIKAALMVPVKALTQEQKKRFDDTMDKLRKLTLADAKAKVPGHKEEAAIEAAGVKFLSPSPEESAQADDIVREAQPGLFAQFYDLLKGSWLPDIVAVLVVIVMASLGLYLLRAFLRWRNRHNSKGRKWLSLAGGRKTKWTLVPLVDEKNQGATELVMDAMARLPIELRLEKENPWAPTSLLLRPKPPVPSETDLLIDFSCPPDSHGITLADLAIVTDLREEVRFQEVSLTDAAQQLQLTIGAYKVDSVAKFLSSVGRWLKTGSPTITGTAERCQTKESDDTVLIRLNCSGGPSSTTASGHKSDSGQTVSARDYLSVTASTPHEEGTDIRQLCADRVVFKLLYRLAYPNATQAETDAQAALRQAVTLLRRCFKQNRAEETKDERKALLEKAAYNLEFARNYLADSPPLLWLEGTALALVGEEKYDSAIARFQELEVAPFSKKHDVYLHSLCNQAMYNHAVLLARKGKSDLAKAMSVYDELLGKEKLLDSVRWLAGLGKLTVVADYEPEAWKYFDQGKAKEWLERGDKLLGELSNAKSNEQPTPSPQDKRTLDFIACEANRALGKCFLRFAEAFLAQGVLKDGRPIEKSAGPKPSPELNDRLNSAQKCLEKCGDDADLLGDRAYIMLLLGNYQEAENHARRAMLWETDSERAYYLAAEACYCSGEGVARERAKSYASDYYKKVAERTKTPATPKLNIAAFTALCTDLKVFPPVP